MSRLKAKSGQFQLYKRGKYWYYWTYDANGKRYKKATGAKTKQEAFEVCLARKDEGTLVSGRPEGGSITLAMYGRDFWNYDTCPIIQGKLKRGGKYGIKTAKNNQSSFDNHVSPFLGKVRLSELSEAMIEEWLISLPDNHNLANKTSNNALQSLKQILDQAARERIIAESPAKNVRPLVNDSTRYGAFTAEQVKALFEHEWTNKAARDMCFVASRTGMRMGEVRAISSFQIKSDHILVNASWSREEGRKSTKSGWARKVPISQEVLDLLNQYCPPMGGLLFSLDGEKPISDTTVRYNLIKEMDEINKEKESLFFDFDNKEEPLTFHSFRHFLNTRLLAAGMPKSKIQAIIGHESDKMTEHYAHLEVKDLEIFKELQKSLA
jgi:integrase